jgi:hypothetical protein
MTRSPITAALTSLASVERIPDTLDELAAWRVQLASVSREVAALTRRVENRMGDCMESKQAAVMGVGVFERHRRTARKSWDGEALLSAVLDSRLVDETTGEIADESPLDKVRAVWNLGAPRTTALRARGIDPDEFCETTTEDGWAIRVHDAVEET